MDIGGDVGGLSASIAVAFYLICSPIATFSFKLKFLKKMYTAKTNNSSIFNNKKVKQNITEDQNLNKL